MGSLLGSSSSSKGSSSNVSKGFSSSSSAGTSSDVGSSQQVGQGSSTGQTTGTFSTTGDQQTRGKSTTTESSTTTVSSQYGQILAQLAQQGLSEIDPVTSTFISQLTDILAGKEYTGSTIPEIKAGVAQAQQAGAQGLLESERYLGQTGAGEGSFGANVLSQATMSAQEATGAVPTEVADTFLAGLPSFLEGMTGLGYSGLAQAAATNYTSATTGTSTTKYNQDVASTEQGKFSQNTLQNYIDSLNKQFSTSQSQSAVGQDFTSGVNVGNQNNRSTQGFSLGDLLIGWLMGGGGNPFSG